MSDPSELPPDENALMRQLEQYGTDSEIARLEQDFAHVPRAETTVDARHFRGYIKQEAMASGLVGATGSVLYEFGYQIPTNPGVLWAGKLILMGSGLVGFGMGTKFLLDGIGEFRTYQAVMKKFRNPHN